MTAVELRTATLGEIAPIHRETEHVIAEITGHPACGVIDPGPTCCPVALHSGSRATLWI
jgi:hypothetical protein